MEVVKAFNSNELHTEITIKGTFEEPLFRANDIATVLEMGNIRTTINDFDETEKVLTKSDTLGGNQQVAFLTEKGLYKVLFRSRKPIAEKFQNWVCEVIKEIRLTGEYKLNKENEELKQQLEQKTNEIQKLSHQTKKEKQKAVENVLINQFPLNTECIYFGSIDNTNSRGEKLIKFGHTNDLKTRLYYHRGKYDNFILLEAFKVQNKVEIENLIKTCPKIKPHIRQIEVNGKQKTEIIAYDDALFTSDSLTKCIKDILNSKQYSIDNFNKLVKQNEELEEELRTEKQTIKNLQKLTDLQAVEIAELKEQIQKQGVTIRAVQLENEAIQSNPVDNQECTENTNPTTTTTTDSTEQDTSITDDLLNARFDEFITKCCIVRKDVDVDSCEIDSQFRIWNKVKPTRETREAFIMYLKTRFMPCRIKSQNKNQVVHGFSGVMLKSVEYKRTMMNNETENFIFECCRFSPNNRILNSKMLEEYRNWKRNLNKTTTENDMKELKTYLNSCEYVQKGTVWIHGERNGNEGYYGLALKTDEPYIRKSTSNTGKRVEKRDAKTHQVLNTWDTIAKAALYEKISASKMSYTISMNKIVGDYYYATI